MVKHGKKERKKKCKKKWEEYDEGNNLEAASKKGLKSGERECFAFAERFHGWNDFHNAAHSRWTTNEPHLTRQKWTSRSRRYTVRQRDEQLVTSS